MKKAKKKLPRKISVQFTNKKYIFRQSNPVSYIIGACLLLLFFCLVKLEINRLLNFDDLMFFLAVFPILYVISIDMNNRIYEQITSFSIRLEKSRIEKNKLIIEVKNIGSINIVCAGIDELKVNGNKAADGIFINFLPVNENATFVLNVKETSIIKIDYQIHIFLDNKLLVLYYEQKMKLVNSEYVIEPNNCLLNRRMYYKWWF